MANEQPIVPVQNLVELIATLQAGNQNAARLVQTLATVLAAQSPQNTSLAVAYSTTANSSGGVLIASSISYFTALSVTTISTNTGTGKLYDCGSLANAGSSNQFATIPSSGVLALGWPIKYGLVVQPSSQSQVVSVSYI